MNRFGRTNLAARRPARVVSVCALLSMLIVATGARTAARGQSIREITPYRPYRIGVLFALEQAPPLTERLEQDILRGVRQRSDRVMGAAWQLETLPAPKKLRRQIVRGAGPIDYDDLMAHWPRVEAVDKVILLALVTTSGGYRVTAREFDVRTRTWGAAVESRFAQAPLAVGEAFRVVTQAFAPLAKIRSVNGDVALVQFLASGLPTRDPGVRLVALGDVLRPILRRYDRAGKLLPKHGIEPVAWTYLTVAKFTGGAATAAGATLTGGEVHCQIHSGRRGVLGGRTRGRTERLAIVVRPRAGSTQLRLRARNALETPLAGYDVYASQPRSLVSLLLQYGMLTPPQIDALERFVRQYPQQAIGYVAVNLGVISADQLSEAVESLEAGVAMGDHLVKLGLAKEQDVKRLLRDHAQRPEEELPRLAISRRWLTAEQFEQVRARRAATEQIGRSDADGNLLLSPREYPLQILYVKHGGHLLAKLPIVPGLSETALAPIINNDEELEAEGFVLSLQETLIDMIVQREILMARFHAKIKKQQYGASRDQLSKLGNLLRQLSDLGIRLADRQKQLNDGPSEAWVKKKINLSYEEIKKLLAEYQDEKQLDDLTRIQETHEAS